MESIKKLTAGHATETDAEIEMLESTTYLNWTIEREGVSEITCATFGEEDSQLGSQLPSRCGDQELRYNWLVFWIELNFK